MGYGSVPEQGRPEATDEELASVIRADEASPGQRERARDALVARYQHIVRRCARRYRASPEPQEDLLQVGYVGLMKAINNFDPAVGENLAAYAQTCVSGEIKRHFRDRRWQMRVPREAQELRLRIRAATPELTQQLGREPGDAELAACLGVSPEQIAETRLASQAFELTSLDAPMSPADEARGTLGDLTGEEDAQLEQAVDMEAVWQHIEELPEREQRLLMLRFFGNLTQSEIGERAGISQMHVSRLLSRSLAYLRDRVPLS